MAARKPSKKKARKRGSTTPAKARKKGTPARRGKTGGRRSTSPRRKAAAASRGKGAAATRGGGAGRSASVASRAGAGREDVNQPPSAVPARADVERQVPPPGAEVMGEPTRPPSEDVPPQR
jgi:hypothetical protein